MSATASQELLNVAMLRDAFRGQVPSGRLQLGYHLGLLLVAVVTVLLPVFYVALIVLVAYGVAMHAVHDTGVLRGGGGLYRLLFYVGPMLVGVILILFMIKPLFARPARGVQPIRLRAADDPLLFAFVEHVRKAVRAPAPREIAVDCNVNASASFRRGLWSFIGHDLRLTIGLPLLAGMSLRQLAGILAHEFGHFSQGSGMRLTYLIRSVNHWFARVVYERDEMDDWVRRQSRQVDFRIGVFLLLARGMVWVTRWILWALMMVGHAIGTFMLRRMEVDADRYEAHLAGSDAFEPTAMRLRILSVGSQLAVNALAESWNEKRLCDDFPELVVAMAERMPAELRARVESADQKPSMFDTHPPDAARIASAKREAAPGTFQLEAPAAALFADLPALSRAATLVHYREVHGLEVQRENLVGLARFLEGQDALVTDERVARRYFHGLVSPLAPLRLPAGLPGPPESAAAGVEVLRRSRCSAETLAAEIAAAAQPAGDDPAGTVTAAPSPSGGSRPAGSPEPQSDPARTEALRAAVEERLHAALRLLETPLAREGLQDHVALAREARACLPVLSKLSLLGGVFRTLVAELEPTAQMCVESSKAKDNTRLYQDALAGLTRIHKRMQSIVDELHDVPYPFEHTGGQLDVATYVLADLPPLAGVDAFVLPRCQTILDRLFVLYARCLGRLAVIAEKVESAVGEEH